MEEVSPLSALLAPAFAPPAAPFPALPVADPGAEPMRARMLNEFVYCPRLFYYEQVEGLFVENADTERGSAIHDKVDRGRGDLPAATGKRKRRKAQDSEDTDPAETPDAQASEPPASPAVETDEQGPSRPSINDQSSTTHQPAAETDEEEPSRPIIAGQGPKAPPPEMIHSRSASMGSDRLGVVAKMDIVEVRSDCVIPVDYKAGSPRRGSETNELWDADKMQLGLQILILRDNNYACDEGVIYYRETKQKVRLEMTPQIEGWILAQIAEARLTAASPTIPPPLVNSPKCVRCSLAPVCLPDETGLLARGTDAPPAGRKTQEPQTPRRLIAARDEERALYLNTPGYRVGVKSEILVVKDGDRVVEEFRLSDVSHVSLFGNIQLSTQAVHELCRQEIPVAWFSMGGWFYGITRGHGLTNVHTRIRQFATATDPLACLAIAKKFVQGKIRNHRTMLMRLHVEPPSEAVVGLKEIAGRTIDARTQEELLGMEGAAAALYLKHFAGMIKVGDTDLEDVLPGLEPSATSVEAKRRAAAAEFTFDFTRRSRRPPTDPVNALLSLAYSLLAKDCTVAALAVGFDPYVGFYHQPRHGKPALALDLMEEFRPIIAESAVLTAINNRMVTPGHFVRAGDAVNLSPHGRKAFFQAYEQRMNTLITHPVFDYKVSYRRVLELQARLLARWLTGEIPDYVPMVTR